MFAGSVRQPKNSWRERVPVNSIADRRADSQPVLRCDDHQQAPRADLSPLSDKHQSISNCLVGRRPRYDLYR